MLSSLLVLVLTLSMVAGTSGVAKAENEGAATVYKIFAIMPDNGDASNFEIADEQPEGKNLFGLLINGGTYTLSDEQEWLHIYANNAWNNETETDRMMAQAKASETARVKALLIGKKTCHRRAFASRMYFL